MAGLIQITGQYRLADVRIEGVVFGAVTAGAQAVADVVMQKARLDRIEVDQADRFLPVVVE